MDYTEDEQLERLKEWWARYGKFVVAAVVLGLGAVVGTRIWTDQRNSAAEQASLQYQQLLELMEKGATEQAEQLAGGLLSGHAGTPYATLATLMLARIKVEQGDNGAAASLLRQLANGGAQPPELGRIARLRLARVLLADGKPEEALKALESGDFGPSQADYEAIRGDILLALGKTGEARTAWSRALTLGGGGNRRALQMKLDDLALAGGDGESGQ